MAIKSIEQQIKVVIAGAKQVPKKTAVFIEAYKEELFMKKLKAALETEFEIECKPADSLPGFAGTNTKVIFITRKVPRDEHQN